MAEFDTPWKEALDLYFEPFMALFFPRVHADIDWSHGYEMLDKELQQVAREAEGGRRVVDKLVRVWLRDGREEWILIHVEVQTWPEPEGDFELRMFVWREVEQIEREKQMPYVTSVERIGIKKGIREGLERAVELTLVAKFGDEGRVLMGTVRQDASTERYENLLRLIPTAASLDEVRAALERQP